MHYRSQLSLSDVEAIIFIVDSRHVRNSFGTRQDDSSNDDDNTKGLPKGDTKFQRNVSFNTALIYGREWRS